MDDSGLIQGPIEGDEQSQAYHAEMKYSPVTHRGVQSDRESIVSHDSSDSDDSVMESFEEYKIKIEQLLIDIGLGKCSIEPIQHGYGFENCVYAFTAPREPAEQYILRVAIDGRIRDSDGRCEALENDVVVLNYLHGKLPVPRVKAYSITKENVLEAPYTIQTRISGTSLNHLWGKIHYAEKCAIVDQYLGLLVKLELLEFPAAGTFTPASPLPASMNDFSTTAVPSIQIFDEIPPGPSDAQVLAERTGADIKSLLQSHLKMYMAEEVRNNIHQYPHSMTPLYRDLLSMLEDMESEGFFADQPLPIVLHHWDLEPRNLMISQASDTGAWTIHGVIDWDDAIAVPRPLARKPPVWIWHFPDEEPEGFLNDDQFPDPELSEGREVESLFRCGGGKENARVRRGCLRAREVVEADLVVCEEGRV